MHGLSACTLLRPERTFVGGSVWLASQADVHQAISAARAGHPDCSRESVVEVVVSSRSLLCIYFARHCPDYVVVKRVENRWQYVPNDLGDFTVVA